MPLFFFSEAALVILRAEGPKDLFMSPADDLIAEHAFFVVVER